MRKAILRLCWALVGILCLSLVLIGSALNHDFAEAGTLNCSTYVVRAGDTLNRIASANGTTAAALGGANRIGNINLIYIGQRISICKASSGAVQAMTVSTGMKPANWRNTYAYGWCTWYAAQTFYRNTDYFGNAKDWLASARRHGYPTGTTPRVGAVVVFQPGWDGAGPLGHVAIVTSVEPAGFFTIREMNRTGVPGGGFGKVDNWAGHTGAGVSFIY
jgi:surface antigen